MIYSVHGDLIYLDPLTSVAVVECGGVGYKLACSTHTLAKLPQNPSDDKEVRLFTYMQVREDSVELFGFSSKEEVDMFKLLISVSGVGPKAGISLLSQFTPDKLAFAVTTEDTRAISQTPGIGAKTAARIVLELKDKFAKEFAEVTKEVVIANTRVTNTKVNNTTMKDAQDALTALGYSRTQVVSVLSRIDMSKDIEEVIRIALSMLLNQ